VTLRPASGTVRAEGTIGYLPQAITLRTHRSVSDLLGITAARDGLHAIEAGQVGEEAFAAVGDDWDVEELVASHDVPFLRSAGITRWLRLGPGLTEAEPL